MPDEANALHIVGIAGSLRTGSYNRMLLRAAIARAPGGMRLEEASIAEVPLYNADLDTDELRPGPVRALREQVASADGLLIASPEYNHSVPGVMQNTIDWLSRPGFRSPLAGKPVGIMGAARGVVGTSRAQQVLKLTLMSTLAHVMPDRGVAVGGATDKFAEDGTLIHEATGEFLAAYLERFAAWVSRFAGG